MSNDGGIYRQCGRSTWRVCISYKGKKLWINQYLDRTPLYSEEQARRVLERIRSEIDQGVFDPATWGKDKTLLFSSAWNLYTEQSKVSSSRERGREMIYRLYFESYWKNFSLKDIEEPHIAKWFSELPNTVSPSYRRVIKATLKAFFNYFTITRRKLFRFPPVKIPQKAVQWLSGGDQEKVLEFIPKSYLGIIKFIMAYGCRPSEACNLRKTDIDRKSKTIILRDRKNAQDNLLPITEEIESIIDVIDKVQSLQYLFCNTWGGKVKSKYLSEVWLKANKKAHIKYGVKLVPLKNGTRHSLASQMRSRGVSLSEIARILGNSEAVVEKNYGRISVERVAEIMGKSCTKVAHQ